MRTLFLGSIFPRLVLLTLFARTNYLGQAFTNVAFWLFIGPFLPWTTLWCAYVYSNGGFHGPGRTAALLLCVIGDYAGNAAIGGRYKEWRESK